MKRSLFALTLAAAMACVAVAAEVVDTAFLTLRAGYRWAVESLAAAPAAFARDEGVKAVQRERVAFVAARSFLAKLAQRARPALSPTWRMVPSA